LKLSDYIEVLEKLSWH